MESKKDISNGTNVKTINPQGKNKQGKGENGRGRRQPNRRPKNADDQRPPVQRNRNSNRSQAKRRGLTSEQLANLESVKKRLERSWPEDEILAYLQEYDNSVDEVVKAIEEKRKNTWSYRVYKDLPVTSPSPVRTNKKTAEPNNAKPNPPKQPQKVVEPKEDIDPHAKAQVLGKTIEDELKEIKEKELKLMNMKQELEHVRGGTSESDILKEEKEALEAKKVSLTEELKQTENRMKEIDALLVTAEKERVKKIREIEEKMLLEKK